DPDPRAPAQHVLLVLDGVRVHRHPAAGLHDEAAHGEVRSLVRPDEHLTARAGPRLDLLGGHAVHVAYGRHSCSWLRGGNGHGGARVLPGSGARSYPGRKAGSPPPAARRPPVTGAAPYPRRRYVATRRGGASV